MRGSPFFRTLMLGVGLLLAGWGILHLAKASSVPAAQATAGEKASLGRSSCGFGLKLSRVAELVELRGRGGRVLFHHENSGGPFTGMIALDGGDPVVFLSVKWKEAPREETNFAKLTLEPPGKPTLTHYFEAAGTIEDVWELPAE